MLMKERTRVDKDTLIQIAKEMFDRALEDFYNPPLPEPRIIYDPKATDGFYIDPDSGWKTTLNVKLVPENASIEEIKMFLRFVSRHEIGHYMICPFDLATSILIITAARKVVGRFAKAMFVANFFADVIDDVERNNLFPGDPIILDALSVRDIKGNYSNINPLIKVLIRVKEILWSKMTLNRIGREKREKINRMFGREIISKNEVSILKAFGIPIDQKEEEVARKIARVIRKDFHFKDKWPKTVEKVARILKDMFDNEFDRIIVIMSPDKAQADKAMKGDSLGLPIDPTDLLDDQKREEIIAIISDNSENPDDREIALDTIEQIEERMGKRSRGGQRGKGAGGGSGEEEELKLSDEAKILWYESISKDLIRFEITEKKYIGSIMSYPVKWRVSDPIEELDILSSLSIFPQLIPGITTIKWEKEELYGVEESKIFPDMLIVIDSSGSMDWRFDRRHNNSSYHLALVGAFAALNFAMMRDVYVAAINFSSYSYKQSWTRDYTKVKRVLISHIGSGTVFPVKTIKNLVIEHANRFPYKPIYLLIITDAALSNITAASNLLMSLLKAKNKVTLFLIGSGRNQFVESIEKNGGRVYLIRKISDLAGLVVKDAAETYA